MSTEVVMPQMGESIAEGTITKWLKKVGDRVERDEPLFEISTDKVDAEIPSPAAGTLTEVRFKEGDTVEVNTVVAVLDGVAQARARRRRLHQSRNRRRVKLLPRLPLRPHLRATAAPAPSPPPQMKAAAPVKAEAVTPEPQKSPAQAATAADTSRPPKLNRRLPLPDPQEMVAARQPRKSYAKPNRVPWSGRLLRNTVSISRSSMEPG